MYNISNGFINTILRWPVIGGILSGIVALTTSGPVAVAASFVAGSVLGTYGVTKLFNDQICDCEGSGYTKIWDPEIDWVIEYNPESGSQRPWELYSMFSGLDYTKQHYASYSSEDAALKKIKFLKKTLDKITKKD